MNARVRKMAAAPSCIGTGKQKKCAGEERGHGSEEILDTGLRIVGVGWGQWSVVSASAPEAVRLSWAELLRRPMSGRLHNG